MKAHVFEKYILMSGATDPDFQAGYQYGLRCHHYGDRFGGEAREAWDRLSEDDPDQSRANRARGFKRGLSGAAPFAVRSVKQLEAALLLAAAELLTSSTLATAVCVQPKTAAHRIKRYVVDHLIEETDRDQPEGRSHPVYRYRLTEAGERVPVSCSRCESSHPIGDMLVRACDGKPEAICDDCKIAADFVV
jgi:hypothetical protein